jgi:hypothetical protein
MQVHLEPPFEKGLFFGFDRFLVVFFKPLYKNKTDEVGKWAMLFLGYCFKLLFEIFGYSEGDKIHIWLNFT